ncbi:hypothetical protein [Rickettsia endosymbiont of Polydrusus tereticollis]|uniref:actin-based motility regulator RoaM n=1 Tax=Rickettsia endosymbiont of Polydrusus tereticollis TaxID=3066251 RepID=UPI003132C356
MLGINEIIKEKLNKLKAELENVYSRIQADYLLGDIKSLANEAAAFGITVDVSGLEKAVETKIKSFEVDKNIDKVQDQEEQLLEAKRLQELIQQRQEIERRIAELSILRSNWKKSKNNFKESSKEVCSILEKKSKELDSAINEENPELLSDKLDKLILTLEIVEKKYKTYKQLEEDCKEVNERHKQLHHEAKVIEKAIKKLEKQFEKPGLTLEEAKKLQNTIKNYKEELNEYTSFIKEVNNEKKQIDEIVEQIKSEIKLTNQKTKDLKKRIEAIKDPERKIELKKKYEVFKNQEEAIVNNGKVKDIEAHSEVLLQIRSKEMTQVANKMKDQIKIQAGEEKCNIGDLSPTLTPIKNNSKNTEKKR